LIYEPCYKSWIKGKQLCHRKCKINHCYTSKTSQQFRAPKALNSESSNTKSSLKKITKMQSKRDDVKMQVSKVTVLFYNFPHFLFHSFIHTFICRRLKSVDRHIIITLIYQSIPILFFLLFLFCYSLIEITFCER